MPHTIGELLDELRDKVALLDDATAGVPGSYSLGRIARDVVESAHALGAHVAGDQVPELAGPMVCTRCSMAGGSPPIPTGNGNYFQAHVTATVYREADGTLVVTPHFPGCPELRRWNEPRGLDVESLQLAGVLGR